RSLQRSGIDPGVDHLHTGHLRSRRRVQMNVVASARQATREIRYEHLRPAALRLADGADHRGDDRDLHRAITLKARSRGGLAPSPRRGPVRNTRRPSLPTAWGRKFPSTLPPYLGWR